ncbi:MAG TPA: hypothetical protein VGS19_13120 [Streptosporangiaceae bacterium]|nr:hypothetical protein [Streptosporangiaceae bacterium]
MPDRASGSGVGDTPEVFPLLPVAVPLGWGGWFVEVAAVIRRSWRVLAGVVVAGTVLPLLVLSFVVAEGAVGGVAQGGYGSKGPDLGGYFVLFTAPVMMAVAVFCGHWVARAWTGACLVVVSGAMGGPSSVQAAFEWGKRRCRLLWAFYLLGVAVLVAVEYTDAVLSPGAVTVRNVLALAGPSGILALILCLAPAAAYRGQLPGPGRPGPGRGAARWVACLVPMLCVLAVVVCWQAGAAVVLSRLMTVSPWSTATPPINSVTGGIIASVLSIPGSVLLIAASVVTYAALRAARPAVAGVLQ